MEVFNLTLFEGYSSVKLFGSEVFVSFQFSIYVCVKDGNVVC